MKKILRTTLLICLLGALSGLEAVAQDALKQKPSPLGLVTYKYEDAYIKVTYSRPHLRGREAFSEDADLAPLGEIWRTGANEATEITLTKDVKLAGNEVPAGTYSIFTIPNKETWTIILNKDLGQWGAYKYDVEKDLIRFEVPVTEAKETYEPFTIMFDQTSGDVSMQMVWDKTLVSIPIEF
ncbi:DUF2911 domain-containing protein [Marivirga sp. S37H4]|uniref:DUF2911 domain-containing protein n=1 Tax=Marivirga aurantiaca TaxID=2802615 RepID=A0A934WY15_9BACT|nr:DUF2911 domain-containing protein [Marivirga aurantiaca]MBK6264890.1 DUF2911 domain-containing protein [Marivirga aurantiaca]